MWRFTAVALILVVVAVVVSAQQPHRVPTRQESPQLHGQSPSSQASRLSLMEREANNDLVKVTDEPHLMNEKSVGPCGILLTELGGVLTFDSGLTDEELLSLIKPLSNLAKVTASRDWKIPSSEEPVTRASLETTFDPTERSSSTVNQIDSIDAKVHGNRYCDVYVSKNMVDTIRSGRGTYDPGTVVVKAKYSDQSASNVELFTVMFKRDAGYNPEHGDWEYCVVTRDAAKVMIRGKLTNCIACHDAHAKTDYVTRAYLQPSAE